MLNSLFWSSVALLALATPALADTITGQVVDGSGVGIAGVDIDVKSLLGGGTPPTFNDGTDAGGFFATTLPAGFYRVTFTPPPPPESTSLITEIADVIVAGPTSMGLIMLPDGVALSGRVLNTALNPVASVNLDVIDKTTGNNLTLTSDTTDAFGNFVIAVPAGPIELRLDTTPVFGPTLAPTALALEPSVDTDVGDITLQPGLGIDITILNAGGFPLSDIDTDVHDAVTGAKLYTPGDNSDGLGQVSVVVPAGTYDFAVCPTLSTGLVAQKFNNLIVAGAVNLGTVNLASGFVLSGTITGGGGPLAGVDVDVQHSVSGLPLALCGDNTNAAGGYAVIVPAGTYTVDFDPPSSLPFSSLIVGPLTVNANTVQHGVLPACAIASNFGVAHPGTGGLVPQLASFGGTPRIGNSDWGLDITNGVGGGTMYLILGIGQIALPFYFGTLYVDPGLPHLLIVIPLSGPAGVAGAGSRHLPLALPDDPTFVGISWVGQAVISDAGSPGGAFSMTRGLAVTFCD